LKRIAMISFHTCPLADLGRKRTGGMNVYVREIGRRLGSSGVEVDVFTRSQSPDVGRVVPLGGKARVVHVQAGPQRPFGKDGIWLYLPAFVRGILDFAHARGIRYDIIHSHYWLSGWAGLELSRQLGAPLVHMFHTLGVMKNMVARVKEERETDLRIGIEKKVMGLSQLIVASTPADRAQMVWYYGADCSKIAVVPCGVDLDLFTPLPKETAKERLGLSGHRILLFVGRIQPIKGLDCLLKAVAMLIDKRGIHSEDLRLLIIGGDRDNRGNSADTEMERLKHLASQLGLDPVVTFLGSQPQEALPLFYSAAEVCLLPSRYESFGMVALESMACGTPVIASRVGGLNYTVRDGQTGYLIPEGNPRAIADRLDRLLRDSALRSFMGSRGIDQAKRHSWENITSQILSLYNRILSRKSSHALGPDRLSVSNTAKEAGICC